MDSYAGFEPQVGEIYAIRSFRIGPGGLLYPLFSDSAWVDGPNTAHCLLDPVDGPPQHTPPQPGCSCGFYAYGDERSAAEYPHSRHVLAVVSFWGGVIAGTRGLRAEHGRIEALWYSDTVPADLARSVAERYPNVRTYRDRDAMLAEHPPTNLECYEAPTEGPLSWRERWFQIAVSIGLVVSLLPARLLGGTRSAQFVWGGLAVLTVLGAVLAQRRHGKDITARRRMLFYQAATLWMFAPLLGPAGVLLFRLPLLEVGLLGYSQRSRLSRAARQFPATIT
jgi:hypothetical protein